MLKNICEKLKIPAEVTAHICKANEVYTSNRRLETIENICEQNSIKVLEAFIAEAVSAADLCGTNGYGYGDAGRDKTDRVFARVFGTEDALVRHNFVSGTHALSTALFACLRGGDTLLAVTGAPYDTLSDVISGESGGSLKEYGIAYNQIQLTSEGEPNYDLIRQECRKAKVVYIQRSCGYQSRRTLTVDEINRIADTVKAVNPDVFTVVDNCYGEFTEATEPRADLVVGSLIKNAGAGIADTGAYICGTKIAVQFAANRLTSVGIGKEAGCSLGQTKNILLGLSKAAAATANIMRTRLWLSTTMGLLGYHVDHGENEPVISRITLGTPEKLCAFCRGVQSGCFIDSHLTPEPWAMPGYDREIIMAAGAFAAGSSADISADAPMCKPYAVYVQGGVEFHSARYALLKAIANLYVN
ncbi:MAG: methionine gamma-lyase family protein [Oscillospiraceae bacterium]|jgi:cystathionine beta-lyase family protein involved in aluminum resistance|nr:methionine gamma-lyase family protein [Oscillospiraceae bacterium]